MEWVLYLVSNLNGDASFLSIPAPSNEPLPLSEDPPGVNVGAQDHIGQVEEEVIFDGNIDDLHQVQIVEQEDLAEVNRQALEVQVEVQNTVKSLVICLNCHQKSPYLRDQVPMGTHFTVLVPIGSLFTFQGPYFEWVWGEQLNLIFQIDCQRDFYSPLQIY